MGGMQKRSAGVRPIRANHDLLLFGGSSLRVTHAWWSRTATDSLPCTANHHIVICESFIHCYDIKTKCAFRSRPPATRDTSCRRDERIPSTQSLHFLNSSCQSSGAVARRPGRACRPVKPRASQRTVGGSQPVVSKRCFSVLASGRRRPSRTSLTPVPDIA